MNKMRTLPIWLMGVRLTDEEVKEVHESISIYMPLAEGKKLFASRIQDAMYEKVIRGIKYMSEDSDYEDELFYEGYKRSAEALFQQVKEVIYVLEQVQTFFDTDGTLSGELEVRQKVDDIINKYGVRAKCKALKERLQAIK